VCGVFRSLFVRYGGSLSVTIGPRQAIAVHAGAIGVGVTIPEMAQQVSVLFSENATTVDGEVSGWFFLQAWLGLLFQRVSGAMRP
jgi:hypothetical protein